MNLSKSKLGPLGSGPSKQNFDPNAMIIIHNTCMAIIEGANQHGTILVIFLSQILEG
jgi:hypothetical protein